jgi:hypothetical protein
VGFKVEDFVGMTKQAIEDVAKGTIRDLCKAIIDDTPVDTGRLRGNWQPDLNGFKDKASLINYDKTGATIAKVDRVLSAFEIGDTFTMTNNLIYAPIIEYTGHSKKAPRGMMRINLSKFNQFVIDNIRKQK